MAAYRFTVTCPRDGTSLDHVAGGATDGRQTKAMLECPTCSVAYLVAVVLTPVSLDGEQTPVEFANRRRAHLAQRKPGAISHKRKVKT